MLKVKLSEISGVYPECQQLWDVIRQTHYFLRPARDLVIDELQILMDSLQICITVERGKKYVIGGFRIYAIALDALDPDTFLNVELRDIASVNINSAIFTEYMMHLLFAASSREIAFLSKELKKICPVISVKKTIETLSLTPDQVKKRQIKPSKLQIFYQKIKQKEGGNEKN